MNKYPTPKQIMEKPVKYKQYTFTMMDIWKKEFKINQIKEEKRFNALYTLIDRLSILYLYHTKPNVVYKPNAKSCYYSHKNETIYINKSLSIISTLHEFAHCIFGPNELIACAWSIHLFKKTFPKEFSQLKWKGHMLVKN